MSSLSPMRRISMAHEFGISRSVHHLFVKFSDTCAHVGEFDNGSAHERADLLLEPRARRGAVPRLDDLALGRSFAPARAAAARRGVRDDRVLGVAQCRRPRRGPGRLCRKRPKPGVDQLALQPVGRRRRPPAWGAAGLWRRRRSDRHAADRRQPRPDLARRSDRPDQPDPSNHHRRGGVGACSQSVRTGRAGEPIAHSDGDARPRLAVDLRPQSLHHGLSRARQVRSVCWNGAGSPLP